MDVLTNKSYRQSNYISRYTTFPYYYHTLDDKYIYGITSQLDGNSKYVLHKITERDTLDLLAYKYYGRPDYYWIIADFNHIRDVFIPLFGNYEYLNIPSLSAIQFK